MMEDTETIINAKTSFSVKDILDMPEAAVVAAAAAGLTSTNDSSSRSGISTEDCLRSMPHGISQAAEANGYSFDSHPSPSLIGSKGRDGIPSHRQASPEVRVSSRDLPTDMSKVSHIGGLYDQTENPYTRWLQTQGTEGAIPYSGELSSFSASMLHELDQVCLIYCSCNIRKNQTQSVMVKSYLPLS